MEQKRFDSIGEQIGWSLARARKIAGLSQEEAAERIGIGTEAYSRIERGLVSANAQRLTELAEAYGCSLIQLLAGGSDLVDDQGAAISSMMSGLTLNARKRILRIVAALSDDARENGEVERSLKPKPRKPPRQPSSGKGSAPSRTKS